MGESEEAVDVPGLGRTPLLVVSLAEASLVVEERSP